MLGIITLRNQVAGASEGTVAYTLAAIKDWTFLLGPGWVVGWGNGLILGYLMYRTGLVPQRAAWLGLIGGPLIIITGTAIMFGGNHPSGTLRSLQGIVTIPEVQRGSCSSVSTAPSGASGATLRFFPGALPDDATRTEKVVSACPASSRSRSPRWSSSL